MHGAARGCGCVFSPTVNASMRGVWFRLLGVASASLTTDLAERGTQSHHWEKNCKDEM